MVHEMLDRLARVKTPLHGPTVVTLALLEAARGQLGQARALLDSLCWLHPDALPAETLEYAFGWLVTDAAAAGDWARVRRFLVDPRRPALPMLELETRIDRLTDACEDGSAPPMPELWREFVRFRNDFTRAVALSPKDSRDLPHLGVVRLVRYLGTWLRLTKKQRPFAHAVFQFLEVEAARAGDDKAAGLARASQELCLPFGLR